MAIADDWGGRLGDGGERSATEGAFDSVMKTTLSDLVRVSARAPGVVRVRRWLIGRYQDGAVGLRTDTRQT